MSNNLDRVALDPSWNILPVPSHFGLGKPEDLVWKMERELARMRAAPSDPDHAFNFFVTAEHVLDWLYPGHPGSARREAERQKPLLAIVSHLANGAKHFDHLHSHHNSVSGMDRPGLLTRLLHRALGSGQSAPEAPLVIKLTTPLAEGGPLGVAAIDLAARVLEYWRVSLGVEAGSKPWFESGS